MSVGHVNELVRKTGKFRLTPFKNIYLKNRGKTTITNEPKYYYCSCQAVAEDAVPEYINTPSGVLNII